MPEVFRKYLDQTKKSPSSVLFLNNANSVPSRGQVPGSKKKKMFLSSVCLDRRFWCCIISKKKSNFLGRKFLGFTLCFTGNENLIMRDIPPPPPYQASQGRDLAVINNGDFLYLVFPLALLLN